MMNRNVSDELFGDELLRTSCDRCGTVLRLNPFIAEHPVTTTAWAPVGLSSTRSGGSIGTKAWGMGGPGAGQDSDSDDDGTESDGTSRGAVFGKIIRTRRKPKFEFNIVSFQRTKPEEYTGNIHQHHQKKLKIKMRAHESKRSSRRSSMGSRPGTGSALGGTRGSGVNFNASAIGDSVVIGDGESAFDVLSLSTYRPETPPPRMRMSVSKMSLLKQEAEGSTLMPAPRALPKVYGAKYGEHLSRTRVLTRFDAVDILKL